MVQFSSLARSLAASEGSPVKKKATPPCHVKGDPGREEIEEKAMRRRGEARERAMGS